MRISSTQLSHWRKVITKKEEKKNVDVYVSHCITFENIFQNIKLLFIKLSFKYHRRS